MANDLNDTLRFGKYAGRLVRDAVINRPDYILFFSDKKGMFTDRVFEVARMADRQQRIDTIDMLVGKKFDEDSHYADCPFPPMIPTDQIPF